MINLKNYLDTKLVEFLNLSSRDEVLKVMVDRLAIGGKIDNPKQFLQAILDREQLVSTGIGMGVAIPHAKLHEFDDFFVGIGILSQGVDWQALDGSPVRIIFMVGGPDDKPTEYLQILSSITAKIKDEELRKTLLSLESPKAIIQHMTKSKER